MLQTIEGKRVYVVEFDTLPVLPIYGSNKEERKYAAVLTWAIMDGIITDGGKYGLYINTDTGDWDVYRIVE